MIIDTLRRAHRGKENDDADMTEVLSILEEIAMETNCAIMFCHHTNKDSLKNQSGNQQYASRGSSVLVDNVRGQFNLFEITNKKAKELGIQEEEKWRYIQLSSSKLNNAEKYSDIIFERQKGSGVLMAINKDFNIVNDIYTATHQSVNIEDVPDEELAKIMCS
jgi:RecA-family ATPase